MPTFRSIRIARHREILVKPVYPCRIGVVIFALDENITPDLLANTLESIACSQGSTVPVLDVYIDPTSSARWTVNQIKDQLTFQIQFVPMPPERGYIEHTDIVFFIAHTPDQHAMAVYRRHAAVMEENAVLIAVPPRKRML